MNYSTVTRKSSEEDLLINQYVDLEKPLLKSLLQRHKIPSKVTIHGADFYYHLLRQRQFIFLALADATHSHQQSFDFLDQMASEFFAKSESDTFVHRPYSLMKLEPWLQDLRRDYNTKRTRRPSVVKDTSDIYAVEVVDLLPNQVAGLVRKKKLKLASFGIWEHRVLITLCLVLFLVDVLLSFDMCLGWLTELRNQDESNSEKIESTLVIFSHAGFIILLGILSPIYLLIASLIHLRQPVSAIGKLFVSTHTWIVIGQLIHIFLFESTTYTKPDNMDDLTTLQKWATLFSSFSLPVPIVVLKVVAVQVVIYKGYFSIGKWKSKKLEKYN